MTADLTVGFCHPGTVSATFMESMLDLTMGRKIDAWVGNESGPRIANARNDVVRTFLDYREAEYLLMVDTDMSFTGDQVDAILHRAKYTLKPHAVIGGLCFTGGEEPTPTLYTFTTDDEGRFGMDPIWNYPEDSLCRVDATGAAFLLIPRHVLAKMRDRFEKDTAYPWFAESERDGKSIGEDITFCMRARALGFPIYVDTGLHIGHRKAHMLTQETYLEWRREYTKANA